MDKEQKLYEIADQQQGFFTARQAIECGFFQTNFPRKVKKKEWEKIRRNIYRLVRYPYSDQSELVEWSLWSFSREGVPLGVWSHDTALSIHNLSDIMPDKLHMTVPPTSQKKAPSSSLIIHNKYISPYEIKQERGFNVTTPIKTIIDCIGDNTIEDHLVYQAITEALDRGILTKKEILTTGKFYPKEYQKLQEIIRNAQN